MSQVTNLITQLHEFITNPDLVRRFEEHDSESFSSILSDANNRIQNLVNTLPIDSI